MAFFPNASGTDASGAVMTAIARDQLSAREIQIQNIYRDRQAGAKSN